MFPRESFDNHIREMTWENRRIIPGVAMAMVKARFDDGDHEDGADPEEGSEHMWVREAALARPSRDQ